MIPAAAALLALAAFGAAAEPAVTGEATFRERIMPPPGARFTATLSDVSRADAPAVEIGRDVIENAGAPPYRFAIPYDPAALDPRAVYAVRAMLHAPEAGGERLMFTSDRHHPAFPEASAGPLGIVMVKAQAQVAPPPLIGTRWALVGLGEATFAPGEAHVLLDADGRIGGSGGCNVIGGQALARDDGAFLAGRMISTMRACEETVMTREFEMIEALQAARAWAIEGETLTLRDGAGALLARFAASPA